MTDYTFHVAATGTIVKQYTVPADSLEDARSVIEELAEADINAGNMAGWDMTTDVKRTNCEYSVPWPFAEQISRNMHS